MNLEPGLAGLREHTGLKGWSEWRCRGVLSDAFQKERLYRLDLGRRGGADSRRWSEPLGRHRIRIWRMGYPEGSGEPGRVPLGHKRAGERPYGFRSRGLEWNGNGSR